MAPLVTGLCTLAGVVITQRYNQRQQAAIRASAVDEKIESVIGELIAAAVDLQTALATQQPRWNAWQPRLLTLGQSILEFSAGRRTGGLAQGTAQAGRIVLDWNERSVTAAEASLRAPFARLTTAISRAAVLPNDEVARATLKLSDAAMTIVQAYATDNLYQPKKATAARQSADAALQGAITDLANVVRERLAHRPPTHGGHALGGASGRLAVRRRDTTGIRRRPHRPSTPRTEMRW
jgi:hypothetical protein